VLRDHRRFGVAEGLASQDVTLADRAMGTGTFLLGILRRIADTISAEPRVHEWRGGSKQMEVDDRVHLWFLRTPDDLEPFSGEYQSRLSEQRRSLRAAGIKDLTSIGAPGGPFFRRIFRLLPPFSPKGRVAVRNPKREGD
jgi:hypothetical protein